MNFGRSVTFEVVSKPQTRGSKNPTALYGPDGKPRTKNGRVILAVRDDNPKSKGWMQLVAMSAPRQETLMTGPIHLVIHFEFARPKNHYRTGKMSHLLKDDAPLWHTKLGDLTKLVRGTEDALTGVLWRDDSQVCSQATTKCWTNGPARAVIVVSEII